MEKSFVEKILDEVGITYSYHHFEEEEAVAPPFICWIVTNSDNFVADGKVYLRTDVVHIELYTDQKEFQLEEKVENVLEQKEIIWEKSEVYIESEQLYEVVYELKG